MSSRATWLLLSTYVLLALSGATANGQPQTTESIRKPKDRTSLAHLSRGNQLLKAGPGSAEEAAGEYKAGLMIDDAPIFYFNLGQAYRLLRDYNKAIWYYDRFIALSPETPGFVQKAKNHIEAMRAELEQKASTTPPTDPEPSSATAPRSAAAAAPPSSQLDTRVTASAPREHWYTDSFGWGLAGAGTLGVAVSGVVLLDASSLRSDANSASTQEEADRLHDRADTRSLAGTIIGVGALGILATGVIKLAIHSDASSPQQAAWGIGASSSSAFVWGRF